MKDFNNDILENNNNGTISNDSLWHELKAKISSGINCTTPVEIEDNYLSSSHLLAVVQSYKPRYDYGAWSYVVTELERLWPDIAKAFGNSMKIGDYNSVSKLFQELRRFMQLTKKPLRIEVAKWLIEESDKQNNDISVAATLSALNLLAWISASCGIAQNISLARDYLRASASLYEANKDLVPMDIVAELYENLVRADIRAHKLESAQHFLLQGEEKVHEMSSSKPKDKPRLKTRCLIPFNYNRGLIYYLRNEYLDAKGTFQFVLEQAELIGWKRVEAAAMSWLATIAKQRHLYQEGQELLTNIEVPDEQRRAYIDSVLAAIAAAQGNRAEACRLKHDASILLKRHDVRYEDMMTLDLVIRD